MYERFSREDLRVPPRCLVCGAKWSGGHERPLHQMQEGLRVFYECGASMSFHYGGFTEGAYRILFKNCTVADRRKWQLPPVIPLNTPKEK
jgi:hypothetical protein